MRGSVTTPARVLPRRAATLVLLCACAAAVAAAQAPDAPRPQQQQLIIPLGGAGFVAFRLEAAPGAAQGRPAGAAEVEAALLAQALLGADNTVHRVLLDREGNVVFAYDLHVETHAALRRFTVAAKPLGAEFGHQLLRARRAAAPLQGTAAGVPTLARAAGPQTLDDGDSVSLDLLVNPRTGARVADVFKVSFDRARLWQSAPRDFTADSAQLAVRDHTLLVGDRVVAGGRVARGVSGALIWFHVPGRGRFVLSLVPRDGYDFRKIALIEENRVGFEFRGERYEWVSGAPIVGGGGAWHAWVLHDPDYTPEIASAGEITRGIMKEEEAEPGVLEQILAGRTPRPPAQPGYDAKHPRPNRAAARAARVRIGAADRMENLLPKR